MKQAWNLCGHDPNKVNEYLGLSQHVVRMTAARPRKWVVVLSKDVTETLLSNWGLYYFPFPTPDSHLQVRRAARCPKCSPCFVTGSAPSEDAKISSHAQQEFVVVFKDLFYFSLRYFSIVCE